MSLNGGLAETATRADAASGTVALGGTFSESYGFTYVDLQAGALALDGALDEVAQRTDARAGQVPLTGALDEALTRIYRDAPGAAVVLLTGTSPDVAFRYDAVEGTLSVSGVLRTVRFLEGTQSASGYVERLMRLVSAATGSARAHTPDEAEQVTSALDGGTAVASGPDGRTRVSTR